tara:strand:- start:289 stop:900 length:612 start_codon:yes stop_codon:yes gene_type:complete
MTTINTALHNAIIADLKAGATLGKAQDKATSTRSQFNAELERQGVKATDWLSPRGKDNGSTSTIEWYDSIRRLVLITAFKKDTKLFDSPVKSLDPLQKERKVKTNRAIGSTMTDWAKSYCSYLEVGRDGKAIQDKPKANDNDLLQEMGITEVATGDGTLDKQVKKLLEALVNIQKVDNPVHVNITKGLKELRGAIATLTTNKF